MRKPVVDSTHSFNPTLVRLRPERDDRLLRMISCFNPTLVRLRRLWIHRDREWSSLFQSHAGSIEAIPVSGISRSPRPRFQSHAGSIEAGPWAYVGDEADDGFNPTLVRLRPVTRNRAPPGSSSFNPTLVRLRRRRG